MRCVLCRQGEPNPVKTTVTLQRGVTTVIVKDVPAEICDNCGEYYLDETVTEQALDMAEQAAARNAEVEIPRYAA